MNCGRLPAPVLTEAGLSGVSAPVLESIEYSNTSAPALLETYANFPFGAISRNTGVTPAGTPVAPTKVSDPSVSLMVYTSTAPGVVPFATGPSGCAPVEAILRSWGCSSGCLVGPGNRVCSNDTATTEK